MIKNVDIMSISGNQNYVGWSLANACIKNKVLSADGSRCIPLNGLVSSLQIIVDYALLDFTNLTFYRINWPLFSLFHLQYVINL
jgi:hypothetical protein